MNPTQRRAASSRSILPPKSSRRTVPLWVFIAVALMTGVLLTASILIWLASRVPENYRLRLSPPAEGWEDAGFEFEKRSLDLANSVRRVGKWNAAFTDRHVNGWLVVDLPKKIPDLQNSRIREPRLIMEGDSFVLAFQTPLSLFTGVISIEGRPLSGQQPNEVILEIQKTRLGRLPIPHSLWQNGLLSALRGQGLQVTWLDSGPNPHLVVSFPGSMTQTDYGQWQVLSTGIVNGEFLLSGETKRIAR